MVWGTILLTGRGGYLFLGISFGGNTSILLAGDSTGEEEYKSLGES